MIHVDFKVKLADLGKLVWQAVLPQRSPDVRRALIRGMLALGYLGLMPWVAVTTLGREIGRAVWCTWLELRIEHASFLEHWRNPEGEPTSVWKIDRDGRCITDKESRKVVLRGRKD